MSRKDTIIIAVLINTGLLIVLFASALRPGGVEPLAVHPASLSSAGTESTSEFAHVYQPIEKKERSVDEVDQVLHSFTFPAPAQSFPDPQHTFASDLQAITLPDPQVSFPEPPATTAAAQPGYMEIKVKKGDVLEKIARHHHTTVSEIMRVNHLTTTNLRIGQSLKIPTSDGQKGEALVVATTPQGEKHYTVKKGDNPWTIAMKHHMKVEDLLKMNHLSEDQARRLKPGDQLRVQ